MKHTLESVRTLAATLITTGSLAGGANAALNVSVSDAGGGETLFVLSGSDTAVTANYLDNEIWFHNSNWDVYPSGGTGYFNFTSGGFSITTTNGGIQNGARVYHDAGFGFGLDIGGIDTLIISDGDEVSWTGSFKIGVDFSNWSSALYDSPTVDIYGDGTETAIFLENVIVSVPEPSSLILLGLGAFGFAARRRRTQ